MLVKTVQGYETKNRLIFGSDSKPSLFPLSGVSLAPSIPLIGALFQLH